MADALGDFFAKKGKKKVKGSNLNAPTDAKKPEAQKKKSKDAEEEGWEEEQLVVATMKVEVAGKLMRDEDRKEEEESAAPAWGSIKASKHDGHSSRDLNDKKFPTLAKSVRVSSNINIDDGSDNRVNIATSKNVFAALENEEEEERVVKRPKEIKPAMVQKKKGERETEAIKREVDKYSGSKKGSKKEPKEPKEPKGSDESGNEDSEEEEPEEVVEQQPVEVKKKTKKARPEEGKPVVEEKEEETLEEDQKIIADLEACKAKYVGRKKPFHAKSLPFSEMQAQKENKPQQQVGKKKKGFMEEEMDKPKLMVLEE